MRKFIIVGLLIFTWGNGPELMAQSRSLHFQFYSGESTEVALKSLSKLKFEEGYMVLLYRNGSMERYEISSIQSMNYDSYSSLNAVGMDPHTVLLTSSPDFGQLILENLPEGESQIHLYSITGTPVLYEKSYSSVHTLDISHLTAGLYLVKINEQVIKFTKR